MRRLWICISVLAFVFALSLANSWYLNRLTGELVDTLLQAQALAESEDWESAQTLTSQAQKRWEDAGGYLYIVLRHSDTDEVQSGFREVVELLEWGEEAEYASANAKLVENIRLLSEMEEFTLRNLL